MRLKILSLVSVFVWVGCLKVTSGDDDAKKVDKASSQAAATALTNSASFAGGQLVDGLVPDATLTDATLLGDDATGVPGEATLLSFSGENPDQAGDPVTATLMQFAGAEDHFEVPVDEPTVEGTGVSFEIEMTLDDAVCANLCNQVFEVKLKHALKTESGGVSEPGELTVTLDCTKLGKAALCGGGSTTDGGVEVPFQAYEITDQILAEVCKTCGDAQCLTSQLSDEYRACMYGLAERYPEDLGPVFACIDDYYEMQLSCVQGAECSVAMACEFFESFETNPPALQACLVAPAAVVAEVEKCEALRSGSAGQ